MQKVYKYIYESAYQNNFYIEHFLNVHQWIKKPMKVEIKVHKSS